MDPGQSAGGFGEPCVVDDLPVPAAALCAFRARGVRGGDGLLRLPDQEVWGAALETVQGGVHGRGLGSEDPAQMQMSWR